jgi:hypothetical protein
MARSNGTSRPLPAPLERASRRFEAWRRTRTTLRIPEDLWSLATELGAQYGVNRTARTLRLQHPDLKKRVERRTPSSERPGGSSGFVEIRTASSPAASPACRVEFEAPSGVKVTVHLPGGEGPDLVALGRLFLGRRA